MRGKTNEEKNKSNNAKWSRDGKQKPAKRFESERQTLQSLHGRLLIFKCAVGLPLSFPLPSFLPLSFPSGRVSPSTPSSSSCPGQALVRVSSRWDQSFHLNTFSALEISGDISKGLLFSIEKKNAKEYIQKNWRSEEKWYNIDGFRIAEIDQRRRI